MSVWAELMAGHRRAQLVVRLWCDCGGVEGGLRRCGRNGLDLYPVYGGGMIYTVPSLHGVCQDSGVGGYAEGGV